MKEFLYVFVYGVLPLIGIFAGSAGMLWIGHKLFSPLWPKKRNAAC